MKRARFEELYNKQILPQLKKDLNISNVMAVPKLSKIVINVGVKDAVSDNKLLQLVKDVVTKIAGQAPVRTLARKSIAGFKLREGMPIGVCVTLRKRRMYDFLDKLITLSLPKVRDFQGTSVKLDGRGNYNLGIKEWSIFPELDFGASEKMQGMNITFHTTATSDEHGYELLKSFGMPFRKA
jgi:large subunit ribosomal protein L5